MPPTDSAERTEHAPCVIRGTTPTGGAVGLRAADRIRGNVREDESRH
jgi:hypothetical protein